MATRNIVPRANNEGGIGTTSKKWANVWSILINALTLTAQSVGFTISGGTTSKTLTVSDDATVSGTNTGDNPYTHPTGDGNLHVPANSTTNTGKVLTASGTAGTYTWETPSVGATMGDVIALTIALGG